MKRANELADIEDWESFVPPTVNQSEDLPSIEEVLRMFEHFKITRTAPPAVEESYDEESGELTKWLTSTMEILTIMGLDGLVSDKPRPRKYDEKSKKWMRLSRLVSLWMQGTIADSYKVERIRLEDANQDITFADKFMKAAKKHYNYELATDVVE
ncbi:hypothetical protein N7466_006332 [Penicillium verhagenii]|uniref:uncharacterized protein n=1 Tax=Penicillium verhagenii TaxID=1562060 RepID=UPI002545B4F9|nr:uncharacterized protein N7466_006332 [Penicillium verhagenii]KAJ5930839.1 hypothetical protein N7466_006332 [Penicillium verhagenii]